MRDCVFFHCTVRNREEESKKKLLKNECTLTEDIIREKDQKCYGVWHHRRWLFDK